MTRILVIPENMYALSAQLQQASDALRSIEGQLGYALSGLDWEARQRVGVGEQVGYARSRARVLAAQAENLSHYLKRKAQVFEEVDGQGEQSIQQIGASFVQWQLKNMPPRPTFPTLRAESFNKAFGQSLPAKPLHLPDIGGFEVIKLAALTYLSQTISEIRELGERVWSWLRGKDRKTNQRVSQDAPAKTKTEIPEKSKANSPAPQQLSKLTLGQVEAKILKEHKSLPGHESCVSWARDRRKDFGGTALPRISRYNLENYGAYNYIEIFNAQLINDSNIKTLRPGTAIVWNKNQEPGPANAEYGHIAIFEGYSKNGILVSDANMGEPVRELKWESVKGLHMIPLDAKARAPSSNDKNRQKPGTSH